MSILRRAGQLPLGPITIPQLSSSPDVIFATAAGTAGTWAELNKVVREGLALKLIVTASISYTGVFNFGGYIVTQTGGGTGEFTLYYDLSYFSFPDTIFPCNAIHCGPAGYVGYYGGGAGGGPTPPPYLFDLTSTSTPTGGPATSTTTLMQISVSYDAPDLFIGQKDGVLNLSLRMTLGASVGYGPPYSTGGGYQPSLTIFTGSPEDWTPGKIPGCGGGSPYVGAPVFTKMDASAGTIGTAMQIPINYESCNWYLAAYEVPGVTPRAGTTGGTTFGMGLGGLSIIKSSDIPNPRY